MEGFNWWRFLSISISFLSYFAIFYDNARYKPFGFRYWLSVLGGIFVTAVDLLSIIMFLGSLSILLLNHFRVETILLSFLFLIIAVALTIYAYFAIRALIRRTRFYRAMMGKDSDAVNRRNDH